MGKQAFKNASATAGVMEEAAKGKGTSRMPVRAPRVTKIKAQKPVTVQYAKPEKHEICRYVSDHERGAKYALKNVLTTVMVRETKKVDFKQWADPRNIRNHRCDTLGRKRPSQVRQHLSYQGLDGTGRAVWA